MTRFEIRLIGRFLLWSALVNLFLVLVTMVAPFTFNGGRGMAVAAMAALFPGHYFYWRERTLPTSRFSWRMAVFFFPISVSLELLMLSFLAGGPGKIADFARDQPIALSFFVLLAVLQFLLIRVFFGLGAWMARRKERDRASRAG